MLMANSIIGASRALARPLKRQKDQRIWAQDRLTINNRRRAEIKTNINDQVGDQWFIPYGDTIVIQLISAKSICRGRPKASSIAGG
jgi:hypothetical protein